MNVQLIGMILQTLLSIVPQITSSKAINSIVNLLIGLIPVVVQEAKDLLPVVQNIIAVLSGNPAVTADQLAALKALDAQVDAAFDAAVAAYLANHPANP